MSKRRYEVEAAVHPVVLNVLPVEAALVPEVLLKLLVYVICDGPPAANQPEEEIHCFYWAVMDILGFQVIANPPFGVVDGIPETWSVYDGQLQLHTLLLNVHCVLGDVHCLINSLLRILKKNASKQKETKSNFSNLIGSSAGVASVMTDPLR